jgi:hypothetical protein
MVSSYTKALLVLKKQANEPKSPGEAKIVYRILHKEKSPSGKIKSEWYR